MHMVYNINMITGNVWTQNYLFNGLVTFIIMSQMVVSEVVDNDNNNE